MSEKSTVTSSSSSSSSSSSAPQAHPASRRRRSSVSALGDQTWISVMDVGQGDCTFVYRLKKGSTYIGIIDIGSKKNREAAGFEALKFIKEILEDRQIEDGSEKLIIDDLVITHGDGDHYNLLATLCGQLQDKLIVHRVILGGIQAHYSIAFRKLLNTENIFEDVKYYREVGADITISKMGLEKWVTLDIITGNNVSDDIGKRDGETIKNAMSLVVLIKAKNSSVVGWAKILIMGDAEGSVERILFRDKKNLIMKIDVLRVGHHGSKRVCTEDFMSCVEPKVIMISADVKYGHPSNEMYNKLIAYSNSTGSRLNNCNFQSNHNVIRIADQNKGYESHTETKAIYTTLSSMKDDDSGSDLAIQAERKDFVPVQMGGCRYDVIVDPLLDEVIIDCSDHPVCNSHALGKYRKKIIEKKYVSVDGPAESGDEEDEMFDLGDDSIRNFVDDSVTTPQASLEASSSSSSSSSSGSGGGSDSMHPQHVNRLAVRNSKDVIRSPAVPGFYSTSNQTKLGDGKR